MALPTTRNTTYSPGVSPVKGNDLNALQDMIIGAKRPSLVRAVSPLLSVLTGSWNVQNGYIESSAAVAMQLGLPVEGGDRITGVTVSAYGNGVTDTTWDLYAFSTAQVQTQLVAAQADNNRAAAWGDLVLTLSPAVYVMPVGSILVLVAATSGASYRIGNIRLTYDRL